MADQTLNTKAAEDGAGYWSANIRIIVISLIIWARCVLWVRHSAAPGMIAGIEVGGTDLGFWFAQQGSIIVFPGADLFLRLADEQTRP